MADQSRILKGVETTIHFHIYKSDGTVLANPGGLAGRIVCAPHTTGAATDNAPTVVDTTGGTCSLVLTAAEMNGDYVSVKVTSTDSGAVPFTASIYPASSSPSTLGAGAVTWTYTLTEADLTPIADADVWVTSDEAGSVVIASGRTNASGVVTFYLDEGTVYVWSQKTSWDFANPDEEEVVAP